MHIHTHTYIYTYNVGGHLNASSFMIEKKEWDQMVVIQEIKIKVLKGEIGEVFEIHSKNCLENYEIELQIFSFILFENR